MSKLIETLLEQNIITEEQLFIAKLHQKKNNKNLEDLLTELGFITQETLAYFRSIEHNVEHISLKDTFIDANLIEKIPYSVAKKYNILPLYEKGNSIAMAMDNIKGIEVLDEIKYVLNDVYEIVPLIASNLEIQEAISSYYSTKVSIPELLQKIEHWNKNPHHEDMEGPVIQLVNALMYEALVQKVSDIHFEPENQIVRVRYRIDGILHIAHTFYCDYWPYILGRLKVVSGLNVAENRRPQTGRFGLNLLGRDIDFRVSSHPTIHGENIVVRLLDKAESLKELPQIGFNEQFIKDVKNLIRHPEGIILLTGPTGCGKTTTLYAMLQELNHLSRNIMTLEEPVEYQIPLMRQSQIQDDFIMGFADGVRSILRQDPDVILIGEIRDEETAQMAFRAAMTGHLVFATLHTNDVLGAIYRLKDLGVSEQLITSNVVGIIAQRLVRTLCSCANHDHMNQILIPNGCETCYTTGYKGRIAIGELLKLTPELQNLIEKNASRYDMLQFLENQNHLFMKDMAFSLVKNNKTTIEEIKRHVYFEDFK